MERFSLFKNKIKKMDSRRRERIGDSYRNPTAIPIPTYVFSTLSGYGAEYKLHVELPLSYLDAERIAIHTNRLYPDKLGTPSTSPSRPFLPERILANPTH